MSEPRSSIGRRPPVRADEVPVSHLLALGDDVGLLEHAEGAIPRREHGYCVDDAARLVVLAARLPDHAPLRLLADRCLALVHHAVAEDGRCRNRLGYDRRWQDEPGLGDWWGRAVWALGIVAATDPRDAVRLGACQAFARAAGARSPDRRGMAYAALGAAAVLESGSVPALATRLLRDAADAIGRPRTGAWPWVEERLAYANALLPEALLAAGTALGDDGLVGDGLALLAWLVDIETRGAHLSVTPVGGWEPGQPRPGFDQQPIEVAHLADACARAYVITGDRAWTVAVERAVAWFEGRNDVGVALADPVTGGCADGLEREGVNRNQGAESTLALALTRQRAREVGTGWSAGPLRLAQTSP